jgi:hypothetical protein
VMFGWRFFLLRISHSARHARHAHLLFWLELPVQCLYDSVKPLFALFTWSASALSLPYVAMVFDHAHKNVLFNWRFFLCSTEP